jgi:branched-chain amino acid transport system substrate-binding protein
MKRTIAVLLLVSLGGCKGGKREGKSDENNKSATGGDADSKGDKSDIVKLVSSLPRTGSGNTVSTAIVNGIRLALEDANNRAGKFAVEYEDWDDASAKKGNWDPEVEAANADKAVRNTNVVVYIGTYDSGAAKIAIPILNKANLVMISPANTYSGLTKPGMGEASEPGIYRASGKITFFRVVPADDIQGRVGAVWMRKLGGKSAYLLDDRSLYGKGLVDVFEQSAGDLGIQILGREGLDPKAQEYRSLMAKIRELNPDFIYFGGTTQTGAPQLVKDAAAAGLSARLMMPDGCYEQPLIDGAGPQNANDRVFVTFGGVPPSKLTGKGAELAKRYRQKYGLPPQSYAVYGYVAATTALAAIAKAGSKDREAIRVAVAAYEDKDGPLGSWKFDQNGDTTLSVMSGNQVKSGAFDFVSLLELP